MNVAQSTRQPTQIGAMMHAVALWMLVPAVLGLSAIGLMVVATSLVDSGVVSRPVATCYLLGMTLGLMLMIVAKPPRFLQRS